MGNAESQVLATAGMEWILVVDSPIGIKKSKLVFRLHDGVIAGEMTDLFNTLLPLTNIVLVDQQMSWDLLVTRPLKVSLKFEGVLEDQVLVGRITSKYPDIPFTSRVPVM